MLELDNVCFSYSKYNSLFINVCLSVEAGHVYGLLGRNGTGKTTLLKLMTAGLKPKSGTCCVFGFNSISRSPEMLRLFFYVPEAFTMPSIHAKDFIDCYSVFYPNFDHAYMRNYLEDTKLPLNTKLNKLSHGQQKKFAIGFALACKTPLLILDEPTNGLDIPAKTYFRKNIIDACSENRSIIISTHQVRDLNNIIDQVIVLDQGEIFCNESIANLSKKLSVIQDRTQDGYEVVYAESIFGMQNMLVANREEEQGNDVDLELFFNATIHGKTKLQEILRNI